MKIACALVLGLFLSALGLTETSATTAVGDIAVVNASSYEAVVAPGSIAACFGQFVTSNNQSHSANTVPLPLSLGGVSVFVDNQPAGLFYSSNTQVNFVVPSGIADGPKKVEVISSNGTRRETETPITRVSPGLFSALSDGRGTAAAQTTFDGVVFQSTSNPNGTEREVQPGTPQLPNVLVLYGTGWRQAARSEIRVKIDNIPARVLFAGAAPGYLGLDQANVAIPWQLSGSGSVEVLLTGAGRASNTVRIKIGGPKITLPVSEIALGQTVNGELTSTDPIQPTTLEAGRIRYYDSYRFRTTLFDTPISIDLRSPHFDAAINLFRVVGDVLVPVASDDFTGGFGNGKIENKNALLLTVITEPGEYVIFATTADDNSEGTGSYTMALKIAPMQQIEYSTDLISSDIRGSDIQTSAGAYLKVYWFRGLANQRVRAVMRSTAFDSYLFLYRNSGLYLIGDDQSAGGNDARIEYVLPEDGVYLVLATPFAPNQTGQYTFTLGLAD